MQLYAKKNLKGDIFQMAKNKPVLTPEELEAKNARKEEKRKIFGETFFKSLAVLMSIVLVYSIVYIAFGQGTTIEQKVVTQGTSNTGNSGAAQGGSSAGGSTAGGATTNTGTSSDAPASDASEAKTVVEAIEGDDKPAGEVDELIIKEASDGREYTINDVKYLYLNNTVTTNLTLSGDGANEMVRVSFKSLDNGHNADSVITGAKEFMISGNKWDVELNLGALINALPENRYEFKIEYLNTGNSTTEGVIGEDYVIIVIDNKAPEALTVNTVYDRDLTISGGNLDTYPDAPVNNELWFMVEEADGSVRTVWTELDPAKVTNVGGVWTVNKADLQALVDAAEKANESKTEE